MTNRIVTVNVSEIVAPTPSQLQRTGAFLSMGATTTAQGTSSLITQLSDLTAILKTALAITSITWSGNVATVTTSAPHGYANGKVFPITIAGATPAGYNGTYAATITGASTFTYPLTPNPGAETVPGTYIPASVAEVLAMGTTFFAQGAQQAVYVLELGADSPANGVSYLTTWITANPGVYYAYLVPVLWASESTFYTFVANYESLTAKTYFFVTMSNGNYTSFTALMKSVVGLIPAPAAPATEFTMAAPFFVVLSYDPSPTNRVPPFSFTYLFGVTPYPIAGNQALINTYLNANVNLVGTGSEGGISLAILQNGTAMDGNVFNYWYATDWAQINGAEDLANEVINGSNNKINPLYYNQQGINRLEARLAATMARGVTYGLVLGNVVQVKLDGPSFEDALDKGTYDGQTVVNAVPFIPYLTANPSDYKSGTYGGLSASFTPLNGFRAIVFNLNVSQFVVQ